jgi:hypothetical protein
MRGLGSELTQRDRVGAGGSKLAASLPGKPVLADGEEGGEGEAEEGEADEGGADEPKYKEININEPIFMEQGDFTHKADDW